MYLIRLFSVLISYLKFVEKSFLGTTVMKKRKCVSLKTYLKMSTWEIISYMYIFLVSTYGCLFVYIQS